MLQKGLYTCDIQVILNDRKVVSTEQQMLKATEKFNFETVLTDNNVNMKAVRYIFQVTPDV